MKNTIGTAIAASLLAFSVAAPAETTGAYAVDAGGRVVHNPFGECWRTHSWTKEKAIKECDPALFPVAKAEPKPAPKVEPEPAPVAAPVPAPAPQKAVEVRTLGGSVLFAVDDANVSDSGRAELDALADELRSSKIESVKVVAHTDSTGTAKYNMTLSERRAATVKAYLMSKGINGNLISTEGKGLTQPVASNDTAEGRAKNRRVEINITAK